MKRKKKKAEKKKWEQGGMVFCRLPAAMPLGPSTNFFVEYLLAGPYKQYFKGCLSAAADTADSYINPQLITGGGNHPLRTLCY